MKKRTLFYFYLPFLWIMLQNPAHAQTQTVWDWHITGGTIVDGTGGPVYKADLLIRGDSIGYIGEIDADTIKATNRVSASGKIITPGFIDTHAHGDPLETPEFRNFLAMGVTSIVLGQDGSSSAVGSLGDWFGKVENAQPAVNIASLSGHGSIRSKARVGRQAPNQQEMKRMQSLLAADLKAGAFGMSTGLEYVPGLYAGQAELIHFAETAGAYNGIIMSHMRSEDNDDIEASLDELAAQGRYTRVHASHLKVVYGKGAGRAEEVLRYIQKLRDSGISFSADTYPYSASYTGIGIVFPDWAKTSEEWKNALQERPEVLRRYLSDKLIQRNGSDAILFGSGPHAGKTLAEAARQEQITPVDLLLQIGPQAASAAHFVMDQDLQERIVTAKNVMISSDGSPTMFHPRGFGSFAKIIRYYVMEKKFLGMEEAIHKMSGLPAETLQLANRGVLKEGMKADVLIFDPADIKDKATYEQPHQSAEGFNWIMVNGKVVRNDGEWDGAGAGKVLKRR
jgi:N-acyl-D-aspartate/D-glutamate deacylase